MKHPHFILVLGMAAWFNVANIDTNDQPGFSDTPTETVLLTSTETEEALSGTTHLEQMQLEQTHREQMEQEQIIREQILLEKTQRVEALQLMEERLLDSRRSALQFLPFEPESRR